MNCFQFCTQRSLALQKLFDMALSVQDLPPEILTLVLKLIVEATIIVTAGCIIRIKLLGGIAVFQSQNSSRGRVAHQILNVLQEGLGSAVRSGEQKCLLAGDLLRCMGVPVTKVFAEQLQEQLVADMVKEMGADKGILIAGTGTGHLVYGADGIATKNTPISNQFLT